jgi:hypothetical protein
MTKLEFQQLRDIPGKIIADDITFQSTAETAPNLIFERIQVSNDLGWEVLLNGAFKPGIPSVTFNFVIRGLGPVCRVCVNGSIHKNAGRTHKHSLENENDPRLNLPGAVPRPDLDGKTSKEIWQILCHQSNIQHTGIFNEPELI